MFEGRSDGGGDSNLVCIAEQCNPNRGSCVQIYDQREASFGGRSTIRPCQNFNTGHAMLLRVQTRGMEIVTSHAFVDHISAFDLRRLPQHRSTGSTSNDVEFGSCEPFQKWRCGRTADFVVTPTCLVAIVSSHSPGARLRFFHSDLRSGFSKLGRQENIKAQKLIKCRKPSPASFLALDSKVACQTRTCTRDIPLMSVVVDEWQERAQRQPRGLAMDDNGALLAYLDSHRLFFQL